MIDRVDKLSPLCTLLVTGNMAFLDVSLRVRARVYVCVLSGTNFGDSNAIVLVGSTVCNSTYQDPVSPNSIV